MTGSTTYRSRSLAIRRGLPTKSSRDATILRLGKVYLLAAEAQLNLGRKDSAAYQTLGIDSG